MFRHKLGLSVTEQFGYDTKTLIRMFKEAGFDAFCTPWKHGDPIEEYAAYGKELGMIYQSIHAPFGGSADMWHGTEEEQKEAVDELIECIKVCQTNNIPIMVAHVYIGFYDDKSPNATGIENYGKVIAEAEKRNVKIAFENTEGEEYLTEIMKTFSSSKAVGYCWDTGHEMCYNYSKDMTALYGDKLIATHLNDNLGIKDYDGKITWHDDLHLLPFDGIADWDDRMARLDRCGFNEIMMFELNTKSKPNRHENDCYGKMPLEEYLADVYKRACRLAAKRKI